MRVLLIGGGGREHALAWALAKSPHLSKLFAAPGNPGIAQLAECVTLPGDWPSAARWAVEKRIDLVVVGPEEPLAAGAVDAFTAAGVRAFGPTQKAAQIEANKRFCKELLQRAGVPTAAYASFTDADAAIAHVRNARDWAAEPLVVKAVGLAAGKGVTVARSEAEAVAAINAALREGAFGASGEEIVIEAFLEGEEASQLCFVQGGTLRPLAAAQDHKPVFDGDRGPNTGGMGAYSPAPILHEALAEEVEARILRPTVEALAEAGAPFAGLLYAGLMIGPQGPQVVEFNCRFGDPEAQVVLPRLKSDLLEVLLAVCDGRLAEVELAWRPEAAVCVALASGGYPGAYRKGLPITGVEQAAALPGVHLFHAGTAWDGDRLITNGGRVLNVVGVGEDIAAAKARAYEAAAMIHFDGVHYRRDIADKALKAL